MAEGAPLLREYGLIAHRGFESHPLRQIKKRGPKGPFLICGKVDLFRTHRFDNFAGEVGFGSM